MAEAITLEFIGRQLSSLTSEFGQMRDEITVLTPMVRRLDGTVSGLTDEVRGLSRLYDRLDRRVRELEGRA